MSGTLKHPVEPGERCIIYADCVNRPTGWWWGIVETITKHDGGYTTCTARITGEFRFTSIPGYPQQPIYDGSTAVPTVNYTVYAADPGTVDLVRMIVRGDTDHQARVTALGTRLDECRNLIKTLVGEGTLRQIVASELAKVAK